MKRNHAVDTISLKSEVLIVIAHRLIYEDSFCVLYLEAI